MINHVHCKSAIFNPSQPDLLPVNHLLYQSTVSIPINHVHCQTDIFFPVHYVRCWSNISITSHQFQYPINQVQYMSAVSFLGPPGPLLVHSLCSQSTALMTNQPCQLPVISFSIPPCLLPVSCFHYHSTVSIIDQP